MGKQLVRREIILAKIQPNVGTDAVPDGTNAIQVMEASWSNEGARMVERPIIKPTLGQQKHLYGGSLKQVTFRVELKGSGTADIAPEYGVLLRACGLAETITATDEVNSIPGKVEYQPASTGKEAVSLYYHEDGLLHKIIDCVGTVSFNLETGAVGTAEFTLTGRQAGESDALLPTPTFDDTAPPTVRGAAFSIGAFSAGVINAVTFDLQNSVATPPSINDAEGYSNPFITSRDVVGSFDPENVLKADKDFIGEWRNGTEQALTTGEIGSTAGNRYKFDAPAVVTREIGPGDRDGIRTRDISFGCAEVSGDDDLTLTYS